jgi:hypothetical protein
MDRHFSRAAKAILESEGFHAYAHTGIVEAVEVVVAAGREKNPPAPFRAAQTKRTTGATDGPKSLCLALPCQLDCGQTGGRRRADARFTLAVWSLAFGSLVVGPVGRCHHRHWS